MVTPKETPGGRLIEADRLREVKSTVNMKIDDFYSEHFMELDR